MSDLSTPPAAPLLPSLRARQSSTRTAQVARALEEAAPAPGGAFNATAAARLTGWKKA